MSFTHGDTKFANLGNALEFPQHIIFTPTVITVGISAQIGSVDDGNITLSNISPATATVSAHIGNIQVEEPIIADMHIYSSGV